MKCPLLEMAKRSRYLFNEMIDTDCLKDECAWWDRDKVMCSRTTESVEVRLIRLLLKDIRDKMPHREEFKK